MKQFYEDMQMFNTSTGWLRDLEGIKSRFATIFKQFPSVRMVIEDFRIHEVQPKAALVDFGWTLYPNGNGPGYHGVGSGVYVQRNGKWAEVFEHETVTHIDQELSQPAPSPKP